ncbi:MFS transporter [Kibdelosporangium aridum]|uniref:MFS transporter n=1 Tax=Kibdelosporangium aridum TaxID=2030 RepID=UPI00069224BF|nr:MFS transporter [Kibdelosporangium aridum]
MITHHEKRVSVLGLALLATPTALSANSTTTVIPDVAHALGISAADATWTATAFGWAAVLGAPLTATLLRSGVRATVLVSAGLVLLGTLLVTVAPTLPVLLAGRAAQAAGGGALVTLAIGLAGTTRRTGAITAGVGLVGAFGPLAGATLAEISWRLPLSLSLIALLAVPVVLRGAVNSEGGAAPVDIVGIVLVMALVSTLVLVVRFPVPALLTAVVAVALLVLHIRRSPDGFIPHSVLRSRVFLTSAALACALSTSYFALLYTVPRLLEQHWSADRIGVTILITLAAGSIAALLFTRYTSWGGSSTIIAAGVLATVLPLVAPWPTAYATATAFGMFAATAGLAWYATRAGRAAPADHRSTALSLCTLCYQLGGAFGPAIAAGLIV